MTKKGIFIIHEAHVELGNISFVIMVYFEHPIQVHLSFFI